MNDCIEKFARECGAWNQVYGNRTFMIDEHFDIVKFARLIVQECAKVADSGWADPGHQIKQHFEVRQ
jgi:hypothetical protein